MEQGEDGTGELGGGDAGGVSGAPFPGDVPAGVGGEFAEDAGRVSDLEVALDIPQRAAGVVAGGGDCVIWACGSAMIGGCDDARDRNLLEDPGPGHGRTRTRRASGLMRRCWICAVVMRSRT